MSQPSIADLQQMVANRDFLLDQYRNLVAHMKREENATVSDGAIYASVSKSDALKQVLDFLNSIEGAGYGGMAEFEIARAHIQLELDITRLTLGDPPGYSIPTGEL